MSVRGLKTIGLVLAGLASSAQATLIFTYDHPLEGQPAIAGTPPFAVLTIQDAGIDTVAFSFVHSVDPDGVDPDRFVTRLEMNLAPFAPSISIANPSLPISLSIDEDGIHDAGFLFDLELRFPTSNISERVEQGMTVSWDMVAPGLSEASFSAIAPRSNGAPSGLHTVIHMQGIGPGAGYSTKLGGDPVPEPATLAALGLGLGCLARRGRRSKVDAWCASSRSARATVFRTKRSPSRRI